MKKDRDTNGKARRSRAKVTRRDFLRMAAGTSAVFAFPGIIRKTSAADNRLVVRDAGGVFATAFREAFYQPFQKATGVEVVSVASSPEPTSQIKAMVDSKNYVWDVVGSFTFASALFLAKEGKYLEKHGLENDKNVAEIPLLYRTEHLVGSDVFATVLGYRTDNYKGEQPTSWADFWDVKKFPGRRSFRKGPFDVIEFALIADGVPTDKLYPLDLQRAFRKLDAIKPHVSVWYATPAQSTQLLVTREVDMIATGYSRVMAAGEQGAQVGVCWKDHLWSVQGWAILHGNPKLDLCRQFISFASQAERQAAYTRTLINGPTNPNAFKFIDAKRAELLPSHPTHRAQGFRQNFDYWAEHKDEAVAKFSKWILG